MRVLGFHDERFGYAEKHFMLLQLQSTTYSTVIPRTDAKECLHLCCVIRLKIIPRVVFLV